MARSVIVAVLAAFGAFSTYSLWQFGYVGLFREALGNAATMQVFFDLCIALALICAWMIGDARRTRRNPWPYVVMTLALGSFGPLLYLLLRQGSLAPQAGQPQQA
jgi:hypothetical protein